MGLRIAIDAMGGDHAPDVVLQGALEAARNHPDLTLLVVGPKGLLEERLTALGVTDLPFTLVDAPDVIGMDESPATAVKMKTRSSIHVGLGLHKQGHADAFVSAGNTGAVMAASLFILGRLPSVSRPSLPSFYPTVKGGSLLIDVGSNVDCKPEHLVQFARMGVCYAKKVWQRENPTVALLNIGEEPGKGNEQAKAAFTLLSQAQGLNFVGNCEGRDVLHHPADVIVTDGFTGNILLKFGESLPGAFKILFGQAAERLGMPREALAPVGALLKEVQRAFDYQNYGGMPLLGLSGTSLIGHGSSSARAIERLIVAGAEVAQAHLPEAISEGMATSA